MSDPTRRGDSLGGEYNDSELPLSAELPKEEYEEVEAAEKDEEDDDDDLGDDLDDDLDDENADDTVEAEIDVVEIVDPEAVIPPGMQPPR